MRITSPDLPTIDPDYPSTKGGLCRLYSDYETREWGGVIARITKGANYLDGDESVDLGEPVSVGYYSKYSLARDVQSISVTGYGQVNSPTQITSGKFWIRNRDIGIYSLASLEGESLSSSFVITYKQSRLPTTADVVIDVGVDFAPVVVMSGGYYYEGGIGDNQWEYSTGILTIHTTASSAIQLGQEIYVEGESSLIFGSPFSKIISFKADSQSAILGVDYMGSSYSLAVDVYNPKIGNFTFSDEGILNLYVPLGTSLPVVADNLSRKNYVISKSSLTYSRPTI